ncbi:hypothetical protein [Gordonia aichiensis]|uniref:hypothetical protein n=1 Tax=Gordonia aichiensis TaxID=36820 RepID=UPI00034AE443|nr:hypothetical protein [Gordonia aichiensis]
MSDPEFDVTKLFPGKFFISTTLDVLESKKKMTGHLRRRFIQRAAMAGISSRSSTSSTTQSSRRSTR